MEATTNKQRLHPLLIAAAISVTVFSAAGVAAITGLIPHSKSSSEASPAAALAPEVAKQVAPAIAHPVEQPAAPKPAAKPKKAQKAASQPVVYKDYDDEPRIAQAPVMQPAPAVQTPKPVPAGQLGIVESVREVTVQGKTQGIGAAGGVGIGAILGNKIGESTGNKGLATVIGAVGGGVLGNEIEKRQRETKQWEIAVRFDNGTTRTLTSPSQPFWNAGDRVRMLDGKLQPV
ncbi:MAG: glycine zipper 2TM domain-containing protein [Betaproteobacteria bacterium]